MLILFTLFLLKAYPVLIFGNRGSGCSQVNCLSPYPENSLASFQDGINSGADIIKMDAWVSKDGYVMISNIDLPYSIDDLTDVITPIHNGDSTPITRYFKYAERENFPHKLPWSYEKPKKILYRTDIYNKVYEPRSVIPTLGEALDLICPTGKKVQIELKGDDKTVGKKVVDYVNKHNYTDCIYSLSSFNWKKYNYVKSVFIPDLLKSIKNDTSVKRSIVFAVKPKNFSILFDIANYYNASGFHASSKLVLKHKKELKEFFTKANDLGYDTMCFFGTGNFDTEKNLRAVLDTGVKGISTNEVKLLYNILHNNTTTQP